MSHDKGCEHELKRNMTIDHAAIEHLALLARLSLSDAERDQLARDLGRIVHAVDTIAELDLRDVPPLLSVSDLESVFRPDEPAPSLPLADVLRQAPSSRREGFWVPRVLEGGES